MTLEQRIDDLLARVKAACQHAGLRDKYPCVRRYNGMWTITSDTFLQEPSVYASTRTFEDAAARIEERIAQLGPEEAT